MVPQDLRKVLGREIKKTLKTHDLKKAGFICKILEVKCKQWLKKVREGMLTHQQIRDYINEFINFALWTKECEYEAFALIRNGVDNKNIVKGYTEQIEYLKKPLLKITCLPAIYLYIILPL
jgi:hypothetical protein